MATLTCPASAEGSHDLVGYVGSLRGSGPLSVGKPVSAVTRQVDEGATPRAAAADRYETIEECQRDAVPDKKDGTTTAQEILNRFTLCRVVRTQYWYVDARSPQLPLAYANFRFTTVMNSYHDGRRADKISRLDDFDYHLTPAGSLEPDALRQLAKAPLTLRVWCNGLQGATCDGTADHLDASVKRSLAAWAIAGTAGADVRTTSDLSNSKPTDPTKDKRAAPFYARDKASWHGMKDELIGGYREPGTEPASISTPLRCDSASYLGRPGCIWDDAPLVMQVIASKYPAYADHVKTAQEKPTATEPYGKFMPSLLIPGSNNPNLPSYKKPLTRLYVPTTRNPFDPTYDSAAEYYDNNTSTKDYHCRTIPRRGSDQCDEYPMAKTWEGAYYSIPHSLEPWRFSLRYIPRKQNGNAGTDFQQWMKQQRVLAAKDEVNGGDEYRVQVVTSPTSSQAAAAAAEARTEATATVPIPADDICTDDIGGRFSCSYGEEWNIYSDGSREKWVIGPDRQVWHTTAQLGGTWSAWTSLGGQATSGVTLVEEKGMSAKIMVRGTDGEYYFSKRDKKTGTWSGWSR
ncbi:hypothetical protein [Streptomyces sp. MK7]|uniref:hypothetical protein n=1 Tax=Streptomyces sp. MK7 TaxID=3067635 RepID=UPI0029303BB2|nr:hypothetical protein [Streptomyces sp. MK7]